MRAESGERMRGEQGRAERGREESGERRAKKRREERRGEQERRAEADLEGGWHEQRAVGRAVDRVDVGGVAC